MRGKLGGSVFNKSRNSYTLQRKQQQPVGSRGRQDGVRNSFGEFQRTWKSLTPSQRVNWQTAAENNPTRDRFGNLTVLSGYNQFLKASMLAVYGRQSPPTSPYALPAPAVGFVDISISGLSFSQVSDGSVSVSGNYEVNGEIGVSGFAYIVDISLPVSAGVMTYHGRWVNVLGGTMVNFDEGSFMQSLGRCYPMWIVGQTVYQRVRVVHVASGSVVFQLIGAADIS